MRDSVKKNYQLDFIKLIFAAVIFIGHTRDFYRQDTVFPVSKLAIEHFGGIGVHVFFMISGLLMTNSIMCKTSDPAMSGKYALDYVLGKGKSVFLPCFTAATISAVTFIILKQRVDEAYSYIPAYFLELFFVRGTGVTAPTMFNSATWYISAMLIAMLPLCYLLIRNRDFYLHVAAPLIGFLLMGYMYQVGNEHMPLDRDTLYGVVLGGVIRALCGLSMGKCFMAYLSRNKACDP